MAVVGIFTPHKSANNTNQDLTIVSLNPQIKKIIRKMSIMHIKLECVMSVADTL